MLIHSRFMQLGKDGLGLDRPGSAAILLLVLGRLNCSVGAKQPLYAGLICHELWCPCGCTKRVSWEGVKISLRHPSSPPCMAARPGRVE